MITTQNNRRLMAKFQPRSLSLDIYKDDIKIGVMNLWRFLSCLRMTQYIFLGMDPILPNSISLEKIRSFPLLGFLPREISLRFLKNDSGPDQHGIGHFDLVQMVNSFVYQDLFITLLYRDLYFSSFGVKMSFIAGCIYKSSLSLQTFYEKKQLCKEAWITSLSTAFPGYNLIIELLQRCIMLRKILSSSQSYDVQEFKMEKICYFINMYLKKEESIT